MDRTWPVRLELGSRRRRQRHGRDAGKQRAVARESDTDAECAGDGIEGRFEVAAQACYRGKRSDSYPGEERKKEARAATDRNAAEANASTGGRGEQCGS